MSNERSNTQPNVNEGQIVPKMQKTPHGASLEKGQTVPPMQVRPRLATDPQTSGTTDSGSAQDSGKSDSK